MSEKTFRVCACARWLVSTEIALKGSVDMHITQKYHLALPQNMEHDN